MQDNYSLYVRKVCRGNGKIFARVDFPSSLKDADFEVRSTLEDGTEMPAKLLPFGELSKVLVLAVLRTTQLVTILARDRHGETLVSYVRAFHYRAAKLSSQVHTFLRDSETEAIRNFDDDPHLDEYSIELMRVIKLSNDVDIVQGTATCMSDSLSMIKTDVACTVLTSKGINACIEDPIILRDDLQMVPNTSDCYMRKIQFSVKIPRALDAYVVWIRPTSGEQGWPCGFLSLRPFEVQWWHDIWNEWTLPVTQNERYTEDFKKDWAATKRELQVQRHTELAVKPIFSIIVPLYNTPISYFYEMIESVINQSYERLELILVNASPENEDLSRAVSTYAERDRRIVVVNLEENHGITENTNKGIEVASGDFLCFLDHDDVLALDALFCYAKALEEYPDTDMFYSDEDHLEEDGSHTWPYFKPDWNPDLLLGMNYVCHFLAVRKSVVDSLSAPTKKYDGAQDHHMAFRVSEKARNIFHCRRVLYHWRVHPGSTASGIDEKPYALEAGRLAVQSHLDRCGVSAKAIHSTRIPTRYEIEFETKEEPLVSILIPNKDSVSVLDRCLTSILEKTDYKNYEIIIIENNSTDSETFSYYERMQKECDKVRVVYYKGIFNYAAINNFGAEYARGDYLLLLNNDTEVITSNWIDRMVGLCMREGTGIVGAKLLYPDRTIQHAGVIALAGGPDHLNKYMPADYLTEVLHLVNDVSAVTGACLMTKKTVFDSVGGLDQTFVVDYNDVDYCWRVRELGYLVVLDPTVELFHYESVSRGFHETKESAYRFEREKGLLRQRWPRYFVFADPMGNPNLDQYSFYTRLK